MQDDDFPGASPAPDMPRVIWNGAISFGLVHIPVALYPASHEEGLDFDWLDKRSMDPVGYKRINKRTGREMDKANIVKGIQYEKGRYVVLSDAEIRQAYPKTTQSIEIERFVQAQEIPFVYLERPYYLAPINKGDKVYALLRETLLRAGRVGIARVVIQTKEHLAALIPAGQALMLNTLRWPAEIRPWDELKLPPPGARPAGVGEKELKMADQLVEDMSGPFDPQHYHDRFRDAVMKLVDEKARAGKGKAVQPLEDEAGAGAASNVVDLTELLKRSLQKKPAAKPAAAARKRTAPRSSSHTRARAARKRA